MLREIGNKNSNEDETWGAVSNSRRRGEREAACTLRWRSCRCQAWQAARSAHSVRPWLVVELEKSQPGSSTDGIA